MEGAVYSEINPDARFAQSQTEELAKKSYKAGHFEEAAKYFSVLILNTHTSSGEKYNSDVEWYIKRCDCYQHLNEDDKAMKDAELTVKLFPENGKGYILLGTLHQIQGHYDEALFCYFDCLEVICLSGSISTILRNCLDCILQTAKFITSLSKNITKEDILTQLYMLGNGLRREIQHTLAIKSLEVALLFYENQNNVENREPDHVSKDENLRMKIYFALAQSLQETGKLETAIEKFQSSLRIALTIGDVSFETKAYISLSSLCLDQCRHAEAASFYIKLLAVGQDVLIALGDDENKFREHWPIEMEANILLNLCICFKTLRLYDEALLYAKRYERLLELTPLNSTIKKEDAEGLFDLRPNSVPTLWRTDSFFKQKVSDLSGLLQAKFILGDLHELKGDWDQALLFYEEWAKLSQAVNGNSLEYSDSYLLDTALSLSCKGNVLMRKQEFKSALDCFKEQTRIAKMTKIPELLIESALSRGDALIALGCIDNARKVFNYALQLSQKSMDDLEAECMCMWKVASVFAAEHRYTTAAYYCEQAVALANKCDKRSVQMKLNFELALYYQHSSSPKELQHSFGILYDMINFQEKHIFSHRQNGGKYFHEEEIMLGKCYDAIQVVLHKLGKLDICACFGEAWRRRFFVGASDRLPKIPDAHTFPDSDLNQDHKLSEKPGDEQQIELVDYHSFLPKKLKNNAVVVTFDLCDEGILTQIIKPSVGVSFSYLSSEHNPNPFFIRTHVEQLISELGDKVCSRVGISNSESRNMYSTASGVRHNTTFENKGYSDIKTQPENIKEGFPTLEELYKLLIDPLEKVLLDLPSDQHIVIVSGKDLKKIPFDSLRSPTTHSYLSESFHITMSPCTYVLQSKNGEVDKSGTLQQFCDNKDLVKSLKLSGTFSSVSCLVTKTASQSSILTSPRYSMPFKQKSQKKTGCVIGCPRLPNVINYGNGVWHPKSNTTVIQECKKVSEYLDTSPILGKEATKKQFIEKLTSSNIIHIVSYGDLVLSNIAFTPDPYPMPGDNIDEESYLFTRHDLELLQLNNLQLVVLNSGSCHDLSFPPRKKNCSATGDCKDIRYLPELFLAAGAVSVLYLLWNVPHHILDLFYFHFYNSLQTGNLVSRALNYAKLAISKKYVDSKYWTGFILLGTDVHIDLSEVRRSQLHSSLDLAEAQTLYPKPQLDEIPDAKENMDKLQLHISQLSCNMIQNSVKYPTIDAANFRVVPVLMELLEEAMDRLTADSNINRPVIVLSVIVESCKEAVNLLSELDFDFQQLSLSHILDNESLRMREMKTVIFPHWNKEGMLLPTHQALTGLQDICNKSALRCLARVLPLSQDILCALIDLLAVVRHTQNVHLRVHDDSIKTLWRNRNVRNYLCEIGFVQIHELIVFFKTSRNRTLLVASLQLFASVCLHRDQNVLEQLNIGTLGQNFHESKIITSEKKKLSTVYPVILPGKKVILISSWMQLHPGDEEKSELKCFANQLIDVKSTYILAMNRVKWWHENSQVPQAQIKLLEIGSESAHKSSFDKADDITEPRVFKKAAGKRESAHYIMQKRCKNMTSRFRAKVFDIYEKYATNG